MCLCTQMLLKKVDALTKAIEVETKKAKREAAAREKENALAVLNEEPKQCRKANLPRRFGHHFIFFLSFEKYKQSNVMTKLIFICLLCYVVQPCTQFTLKKLSSRGR